MAGSNRDSQSVQRALLIEFPYVGIWWPIYDEPPADHGLMDLEFVASQIAEFVETFYDGDYLGYTLETVADEVERMVGTLCRPGLMVEEGSHDPSEVTAQWHFKSLLGAMYLQMYWLMAAGSELTRCENCGRLISLARPLLRAESAGGIKGSATTLVARHITGAKRSPERQIARTPTTPAQLECLYSWP